MQRFTIQPNTFLATRTNAYYSIDYHRRGHPQHPTFLTDLKNTFDDQNDERGRKKLNHALQKLCSILRHDLTEISENLNQPRLILCVVPRAKAEKQYSVAQTLFRYAAELVAGELENFVDGSHSILRHTNTRTTHLQNAITSFHNDGDEPYPGITQATCTIDPSIRGQNILLVDDIYTPRVNIDEDAIQALYNCGAAHVTFYAVAKTPGFYPDHR
jgi:predicted amidophosphoribosyltransferase